MPDFTEKVHVHGVPVVRLNERPTLRIETVIAPEALLNLSDEALDRLLTWIATEKRLRADEREQQRLQEWLEQATTKEH